MTISLLAWAVSMSFFCPYQHVRFSRLNAIGKQRWRQRWREGSHVVGLPRDKKTSFRSLSCPSTYLHRTSGDCV